MRTSEKTDAIFPAYVAAQADLRNAAFDKVNPHFKSRYATLAGVRDLVVPLLAKHGLAVVQGSHADERGTFISTRMVHTSGQWIESLYPFALGKPQEMGSAMTYARRYSLSAICNIASEEDDDGNASHNSHQDQQPAATQRPALKTVSGGPATPKAQSREPFEKIQAGIRKIGAEGTHEDLGRWFNTHATIIEGFEASWHDLIMSKFTEARADITARLGPKPDKKGEAA